MSDSSETDADSERSVATQYQFLAVAELPQLIKQHVFPTFLSPVNTMLQSTVSWSK